MNIWPPEELWITLGAIFTPIIYAPLAAWHIGLAYIYKFNHKQIISLGEFGNLLGSSILLFIAAYAVISFFINAFNDQYKDKKAKFDDVFGYLLFSVPCIYISLNLVIYFMLKMFFNY